MVEKSTNEQFEANKSAWGKVKQALENQNFDFRTYDGIASEAQLSKKAVEKEIFNHRTQIRFALNRSPQGEKMVALRSKSPSWREKLSELRFLIRGLRSFAI